MKNTGRIAVILAIIPAVIITAAVVFYLKPFPEDYETFIGMRKDLTGLLKEYGAGERAINEYFTDYSLKLNPLYSFMFKTRTLSLYLKSYESKMIDTATINQLEIGKNSGTFFDFTFMIRPKRQYSLPFFHGDALKALPGVEGALYMDFYSFDNTMPLEQFFGSNISRIIRARDLAAPYWKIEGFGELTNHLDQYKSPYRFEILEPEKVPEDEREEYFNILRECFNLYTQAYMESLHNNAGEAAEAEVEKNLKGIRDFVDILYEYDIAVKMGKMIFAEEDFDKYFLNGFWGVRD